MLKLRPYQIDLAKQILQRLEKYNLCYLSAEVRTGKTLTALEAAKLFGADSVCFVTKKSAISSIESDYKKAGYKYNLEVINYESVHKVKGNFNLVILDEAHVISSFAKPAKRTKLIKKMFSKIPILYLSGTPAIESGSQWYHQFWVSDYSPFKEYKNFYKWAKDYVTITEKNFGYGRPVKDYSDADRDKIFEKIKHILITFTQEKAGFQTSINEKFLYFDMKPITMKLAKKLINDRVVEGKTDVILADTPVKLQNKIHQIYNGTCIGETGDVILLDDSKAKFIKQKFQDNKLAIFYQFKGELKLLQSVFKDKLTTDLPEFNSSDKNIAIQQSSTEGLNLSKADYIVYYNFGFSGKNYTQSRDRLTTMQRKNNDVYFIFERGGISEKIYKAISQKMSYNIQLFKRDYL